MIPIPVSTPVFIHASDAAAATGPLPTSFIWFGIISLAVVAVGLFLIFIDKIELTMQLITIWLIGACFYGIYGLIMCLM